MFYSNSDSLLPFSSASCCGGFGLFICLTTWLPYFKDVDLFCSVHPVALQRVQPSLDAAYSVCVCFSQWLCRIHEGRDLDSPSLLQSLYFEYYLTHSRHSVNRMNAKYKMTDVYCLRASQLTCLNWKISRATRGSEGHVCQLQLLVAASRERVGPAGKECRDQQEPRPTGAAPLGQAGGVLWRCKVPPALT